MDGWHQAAYCCCPANTRGIVTSHRSLLTPKLPAHIKECHRLRQYFFLLRSISFTTTVEAPYISWMLFSVPYFFSRHKQKGHFPRPFLDPLVNVLQLRYIQKPRAIINMRRMYSNRAMQIVCSPNKHSFNAGRLARMSESSKLPSV